MRKIETEMLSAISRGLDWHKTNTKVVFFSMDRCHFKVYLHNNLIAMGARYGNFPEITWATLAGWDTVTTRSRLRALGVDVPQLRREEGYIQPRKPRKPRQPRIKDDDFDI